MIQTTNVQPAQPVVLQLENDSAEENPVYEMGELSPEQNLLTPSITRRNVVPPKFYGERLYIDVIGEQASGTAGNPFTLSKETVSDNIFERLFYAIHF